MAKGPEAFCFLRKVGSPWSLEDVVLSVATEEFLVCLEMLAASSSTIIGSGEEGIGGMRKT